MSDLCAVRLRVDTWAGLLSTNEHPCRAAAAIAIAGMLQPCARVPQLWKGALCVLLLPTHQVCGCVMFLCAKKGQPRSAALQPHMPWQSHSPTLFCLQPLASACSINSVGDVGPMSRPGRPGQSCACGALIKATGEIKAEGVMCNCEIPGGEQLLPACTPDCPATWLAGHLPPIMLGALTAPAAPTHLTWLPPLLLPFSLPACLQCTMRSTPRCPSSSSAWPAA